MRYGHWEESNDPVDNDWLMPLTRHEVNQELVDLEYWGGVGDTIIDITHVLKRQDFLELARDKDKLHFAQQSNGLWRITFQATGAVHPVQSKFQDYFEKQWRQKSRKSAKILGRKRPCLPTPRYFAVVDQDGKVQHVGSHGEQPLTEQPCCPVICYPDGQLTPEQPGAAFIVDLEDTLDPGEAYDLIQPERHSLRFEKAGSRVKLMRARFVRIGRAQARAEGRENPRQKSQGLESSWRAKEIREVHPLQKQIEKRRSSAQKTWNLHHHFLRKN